MSSDQSSDGGCDDALAVFVGAETPSEPRTAADVAATIGVDESQAQSYLEELVDDGDLRSKAVGSAGRVWWRPPSTAAESPTDEKTAYFDAIRSQSTDYVLIINETGQVIYNSPPVDSLSGWDPTELVGSEDFSNIHPDDRSTAREAFAELLSNNGDEIAVEFRVEHLDGSWRWIEVTGVDMGEDPIIDGVLLNVRDTIARMQQPDGSDADFAVLNSLNQVFREVTEAALDQSTRREIEETISQQLVDSNSYAAAWIGGVEPGTDTITIRAVAGLSELIDPSLTDGSLVEWSPATDAIRADSLIVADDCCRAADCSLTSCAVVPITHDSTQYGVLGIGTDREDAFGSDERAVLRQLGELVGHVIAATERQRALLSDEIIELSFEVDKLFDDFEFSMDTTGRITYSRSVPIRDGGFLVYGTATGDSLQLIETLVDSELAGRWESVMALSTVDGVTTFELYFTDHPVFSTVQSQAGYVDEAIVENGVFRSTFHFAPNADVQQAIDSVKRMFPGATLVTRQRRVRPTHPPQRLLGVLSERLTERQLAALEAAYGAGFFDWPRGRSAEAIADSLGIAPSTYHQHLRKAQQTLMEIVFEGESG